MCSHYKCSKTLKCISLLHKYFPPGAADSTAVSEAFLIEKLINFLKSSAVSPANHTPLHPRDQLYIMLNDLGPAATWEHLVIESAICGVLFN